MPDKTSFQAFTIENVPIENYNLGANSSRQLSEKGGVAIFVRNSLCFSNTLKNEI
jgi:hypothetical protein